MHPAALSLCLALAAALVSGAMAHAQEASAPEATETTAPTATAPGATPAASPQAVAVVAVEEAPWTAVWEAYGVLQADDMAQARTEGAGGTVQAVLVKEGDLVAMGEPLVQLSATDADFALREAQNALESAQTDLREQEALLARAQALGGNTPKATLETRVFAADRARVAVERAGVAVLQAEEATRRTVVRSPVDGRVVTIDAALGAQAAGATVLASVAAQDRWVWEGGLPTRAAAALAVGASVEVQAGGRTWDGTVARVSPRVDANGLAVVTVDLNATPDARPLEGATGRATFAIEQGTGITLPAEALIYRNGLPWVATVRNDGTVAFTPITVREVGGANLLVDGLDAGTKVVASGADFLSDGQRVSTVANTQDTAPGAQVAP